MKKVRIGLIFLALVLITGQLIVMDYDNLSWSNNAGSYLGILAMLLLILSMLLANRHQEKT